MGSILQHVGHNGGVAQRKPRKANNTPAGPLLGQRAVNVAREALRELDQGQVGEHIGVSGLSNNAATHRFEATVPGYTGWEWNAVVACATGSDYITVSEVALVPAPTGEALQAPDWVPYSDRLRPGDLGPGDLMEPAHDDERLTADSFAPDAVTFPGRETAQYLTKTGLDAAKNRWRRGDFGPNSAHASQAALQCKTCAFFIPAGEPLGDNFGVCANEYSADGRVVSAVYGCGAHSETKVDSEELDAGGELFDDEKPLY